MLPAATFDTLVAGFYRAATGEITWPQALDGVQTAFTARAAVLQTIDVQTHRMLRLDCAGPGMEQAVFHYVRDYHPIDPRRQQALQCPPEQHGEWFHCHEYFDEAFVEGNRFYQHYLAAYETRYNAHVTFPIGEGVITGFILELPSTRGVLNGEERETARRLGVHMREALLAHERVRRIAAQALAGHGLLETFAYPMWLLDTDRFVLFANQAAQAEQATDTRVALNGSRLALRRDAADQLLTQRLHALAAQGHGARGVVDLRATASDAPTWLHLSLLVPGAVLGAFGDRPLVLATLFDPLHVRALDPFALANMFGLTPTEAKLATRMADGLTAEAMAAEHGSSVATVRTHIRQILAKLGAARMTDAVRLLRQGEALWAAAGTATP